MIGTRQKNDNFQVHHIHDGATWPVLIVEIRSPFYQVQGFSHDGKIWNSRLGGTFTTVKTYAARKEGVPVTKSRPFLSRNFSKHFPACKYLNLNHCTITCCWLELASNATNIRWQVGLQIVLGCLRVRRWWYFQEMNIYVTVQDGCQTPSKHRGSPQKRRQPFNFILDKWITFRRRLWHVQKMCVVCKMIFSEQY